MPPDSTPGSKTASIRASTTQLSKSKANSRASLLSKSKPASRERLSTAASTQPNTESTAKNVDGALDMSLASETTTAPHSGTNSSETVSADTTKAGSHQLQTDNTTNSPPDASTSSSSTPLSINHRSEGQDVAMMEDTLLGLEGETWRVASETREHQIQEGDTESVPRDLQTSPPTATTPAMTTEENATSSIGYGEEFVVIPIVARTLTSPTPGELNQLMQQPQEHLIVSEFMAEDDAFMSYGRGGEDSTASGGSVEEHGVMGWTGVLCGGDADNVWDDDNTTAATRETDRDSINMNSASGRGRQHEGTSTPMLRPTTPTAVVPLATRDLSQETNAEGAGAGDVSGSGEGTGVAADAAAATTTKAESIVDVIDREELIARIKSELDAKDRCKLKNTVLQNRLAEYFRRKRAEESQDGEKSVLDQEQRYTNCMSALTLLRTEYDSLNSTNQKIIDDLQRRLTDRLTEANERSLDLSTFKRTVASTAENSRTGKPIPLKAVQHLEELEKKKETEVISVRLEHIKLRNKLRRHELLLRQKEELADGLHLIDFEQLKIENQTYNEKIEERNEELIKLKKKITNVVQVLTHVKEKLQFVQGENINLKVTLRDMDTEVSRRRDALPVSKQSRDALRNGNTALKQRNGLLGNASLLRDFEDKVDDRNALNEKIDDLRSTHANLAAEIMDIRRRIQRKMIV